MTGPLTNYEVTVFGPKTIRKLLIAQTEKSFLPRQVLQIFSDHVNGKFIPAKAKLSKQV